jgi:hypothetical protein
MMCLRVTAAAMAAVVWLLPGLARAQAGATFVPAALSGNAAPSSTANFTNLAIPAIDSSGRLVFVSGLSGGDATSSTDTAIWSGVPGALVLVAREGSSAPLAVPDPDVRYGEFSGSTVPNINTQGKIIFKNFLSGPAVTVADSQSLWIGAVASISLLARAGETAPGTSDPFLGFGSPQQLNNVAGSVFQGQLAPLTPARSGIWSGQLGSLALVATTGDAAPGAPGAKYNVFGNTPVVNASGTVAFRSDQLTGGGSRGPLDVGLWVGAPGSVQLLARFEDPVPGVPGTTFLAFNSEPVINAAGTVAFRGNISDGTVGIWWGSPGNLTRVARTGQLAPGTGAKNYSILGIPVVGGGGNIAFTGSFNNNPGNIAGLWTGVPDPSEATELTMLVRGGDPAPGTSSTFSDFFTPTLNSYGQVAFGARLDNTTSAGLFAVDPFGQVVKVVKIGDSLPIGPSQVSNITTFSFAGGAGGEDGKPMSFNDASQLAFQASLNNGSTAIYVARVGGAAQIHPSVPTYGPAAAYAPGAPLNASGPESEAIHTSTGNVGYVRFSGFAQAGLNVFVYLDVQGTPSGLEAVERELSTGADAYGYTVDQVDPEGALAGFNLLLIFADASTTGTDTFYWNLAHIDGATLVRIAIVPEPATGVLIFSAALLARRRRRRPTSGRIVLR